MVWHYAAGAFAAESRDGADTVLWAAGLPGSDGQVGSFGVSYSSWLAWCMAAARPEGLRALAISGIPVSIRDMTFGIFETGRRLQWTYAQAAGLRARSGDGRFPATLAEANRDWTENLRGKWLWHLPLAGIPGEVFGPLDGPLKAYMNAPATEFWPFGAVHDGLDFPVLVQTGWWDRLSLTVRHFEGLMARGDPASRPRHRLVIGPWPHHPFHMHGRIGPVDYGEAARIAYPDMVADWYDTHLRGRETELACGAPVQLFIVNANLWRGFSAWPPPGVRIVPFFLRGGGRANTPAGDGRLSPAPPGDEPADGYVYDPADPVMSLMGADSQMLPVDQRPNERRSDILVYTSAPLERDLLLVGPVEMELWAASDRTDTDFAVKLIELRPDGLAINISSGILRARWREGYEHARPLRPGEPALMRITLLPVGILLAAGSRLRVDVASADFPAFDRNHNTGGHDWEETELLAARQTVFHDAARPSRILLPVLGQ